MNPASASRLSCNLIVITFLACVPLPAMGAVFVVNTTLDLQDINPGDGVCADGTGQCALRAAIMEANALPGADEIEMPNPGWYRLTIPGAGENASFTGDLDITGPLTINGLGPDQTLIDASLLSAADRVFHVRGTATIRGLTIRGGNVTGWGGGVAVSGDIELSDCVIEDNSAHGGGGVGFVSDIGVEHSLSATGCTFRDNTAVGENGGGIGTAWPNPPTHAVTTHVALTDCTVSGNISIGRGGGVAASDMSLNRCRINGNVSLAGSGGGLWGVVSMEDTLVQDNIASSNGGGIWGHAAHWARCDISRNYAGGSGGGADIDVSLGTASMGIIECRISDNSAGIDGGGVRWRGSGVITRCTVSDNFAGQNGGASAIVSDWPQMQVWESTISGNRADRHGGGLYLNGSFNQDIEVRGATITNNSAGADPGESGAGGGVYNAGQLVTITSTILGGNFVGTSGLGTADCAPYPGMIQFFGSVVGVATGCYGGSGCPSDQGNCLGSDFAPIDPQLELLGDYGGFAPTHALLPGSPAIDRGYAPECPAQDQRGVSSPQDGDGNGAANCDCGATEFVDCNTNAQDDGMDIALALSVDCNANLAPDACDIAQGRSYDCQLDDIPDECQLEENDCNATGVPDECEAIGAGDFDGDGSISSADHAAFVDALFGPETPPEISAGCWYAVLVAFDFDSDLDIDLYDFAILQQQSLR